MVLELPEVAELKADAKADRPIVVFSIDRIPERPSLRVALDAGVVRIDVIETGGVHDGFPNRTGYMGAARPMTAFAADIPFRDALRFDVVVDRMAAVAQRPGGALRIVGRIERHPPVGV